MKAIQEGIYKIEFFVYKTIEQLQKQQPDYTFEISNEDCKTNFFGYQINCLPSMSFNISAIDFNNYKANITLTNLQKDKMILLQRTLDEIMMHKTINYIVAVLYIADCEGVLQKMFQGQIITGIPATTTTMDIIQIELQPDFSVVQTGFQLKVFQKENGKISTYKTIKEKVAEHYKLKLKSISQQDNKPLESDIIEYVEKPLEWLKKIFPIETIYSNGEYLYFFDKTAKNVDVFTGKSFELNELNGLGFVKQINSYVFECSCILLPNLSINSEVKISPISTKNLLVLNGEVEGVITNITHTGSFSYTSENNGHTTFQLLLKQ